MSNVLITGSEGLVGRALKSLLLKAGFACLGIDHKAESSSPDYGDITNAQVLKDKISQVDGIVHLAAVSRVVWGEKDPELCWQTNVEATKNILDIAATQKYAPWVVYASSREVYGQQQDLPVDESAQRHPVNVYARSKVAAEDLVLDYKTKGFQACITRLSNVYGRVHDHPDRVVPAFCYAAAYGKDMFLEGQDNIFDFTHVDDVCRGLKLVIDKLVDKQEMPTMHFTTNEATSLLQLATLANQVGGQQSKLIQKEPRNYDVARFVGDPSLARDTLGWHHQTSLQQGVADLIAAFRAQGN